MNATKLWFAFGARGMPRRRPGATAVLASAALGALLLVAACGGQATAAPAATSTAAPTAATAPTAVPTAAPSPAATPTTAASPAPMGSPEARPTASPTPQPSAQRATGGTRVRFNAGSAEIVVRTAENPTSRDFVSQLPLTLAFKDFAAMEKLTYLPRRLTTDGSTGNPPANGDLIYYAPWGNLGFFYDAERRDTAHDDRVIPIGTVESGYEFLSRLEAGPVRVERIP
jgi:hypothetical protein